MKTCTSLFVSMGLLIAQTGVAATATSLDKCSMLKDSSIFNGMAQVTAISSLEIKPDYAYCVARGRFADSGLELEVRLPMRAWNGKLVYLGGGGFNGFIPPFSADTGYFSRSIIDDRYAVIVSNGGYDGPPGRDPAYFKAQFAADPQKLVDFMFQSVHRALPVGQEIVRLYYGSAAEKGYFEGCSTGGHEAMIEAQRYPKDFDGIVARAPAANFVGLYTQFNRVSRLVRTPEGSLNPAKRELLANAVLAQCDAQDGLADGILSRPAACDFDPKILRCPNGSDGGDTCLSDAHINTVLAVTTPYQSKDGSVTHAGYYYGGENSPSGWGSYVWPSEKLNGDSVQGLFSSAFIRSFVTRDPGFDTSTWDPNEWLPALHLINEIFQATDANLSGFERHGGKLIIWSGAIDTSPGAPDNVRYYDQVVRTMGQDRADRVMELFLAPGVGHCFGGEGPDRVDLLRAVSTWVEKGTPPSQQNLDHEKQDANGNVMAARPVCKYPAYPRYRGSGDVKKSSSFTCATD